MITKSMMMMIKIDSFLTESKQGFIRRISRVASSTHYLLTLKLTYHMKKYLLTKNYLLIKKNFLSRLRRSSCFSQFSIFYVYISFQCATFTWTFFKYLWIRFFVVKLVELLFLSNIFL